MRNWLSILGSRHGRKLYITDPSQFIIERAMRDERLLSVVHFLEKSEMERTLGQGGFTAMADGIYYRDTRQPIMIADATAVTLSTTALCTPAATTNFCFLPSNYYTVGKTIKHTQFGKMTTAVTPGNLTWSFSLSNTDNTRLTSSAAIAGKASQGSLSYKAEGYATCRTTGAGSAGTAMVFGLVSPNLSLLNATTMYTGIIPDNTAVVTTFDSTATQGFNFQVARSGSTAETITTQQLYIEALN